MQTNNKLIVVLGMHRSGTSTITRGLQVLGVSLGRDLMPPIMGNNDKGFWEDIDIYRLDMDMLAAIGSDWNALAPVEESHLEVLRAGGYYLKAIELLRNKISVSEKTFGFKDPRVAKLLPFWKQVFYHCRFDVSYVLAIRNPLSVARSLKRRDGIPPEQSYYLWLGHVLESLVGSRDCNRIIVDYDRLMQSPGDVLKIIANRLDLVFDSVEYDCYKSDFIEAGLRHTVYDVNDLLLDSSCPSIVYEIYSTLLDVADGYCELDDQLLQDKIYAWFIEFRRIRPLLNYTDTICAQQRVATQAVSERDEQIASLKQSVTEQDGQIAGLNQAVSERDGQIAGLNQAVSERDGQIAGLNQAVSERDGQIAGLNQAVSERDGNFVVSEREKKKLGAELRALRSSLSWRWTSPIRHLAAPFVLLRRQIPILKEAIRLGGGVGATLGLTARVLKHEGLQGIRWRLGNAKVLANQQKDLVTPFSPTPSPIGSSNGGVAKPSYIPYQSHTSLMESAARIICFYLPQFHAIPENDQWWGSGFTEWTKVKPAVPQFNDHYQPHVPGDLGYYNLLDGTVLRRQIDLARNYGITAFCFYFYWFGGKRLLETPIINYFNDKTLELPFCLCWANESWTRRWDGMDQEILISQNHSPDDDIAFIRYLAPYLRDQRYVRIDGRPLLLVYRPSLLPSALDTALRWRDWCRKNDIGEIYLAYTQSFESVDPGEYGFDAAIEFPPNNFGLSNITGTVSSLTRQFSGAIFDWQALLERSRHYGIPAYRLFRGVCPSWDNTARRGQKATILVNSNPEGLLEWLRNAVADTHQRFPDPSERLVFINAWNEWAEGAHLEPDQRYGYAWLEAVRSVQVSTAGEGTSIDLNIWCTETRSQHEKIYSQHQANLDLLFGSGINFDRHYFLSEYLALLRTAAHGGAGFRLEEGIPICDFQGESIRLTDPTRLALVANRILQQRQSICFIVLQFNAIESSERCIESLRVLERFGHDIHIVLVDNGSNPAIVAKTHALYDGATDITVLYSEKNLGFSAGHNIGYRFVRDKFKARFIIALNNDIVIDQSDFIDGVVKLFEGWAFSIAGPDIVIPDGRRENPWNDYVYGLHEWRYLASIRDAEKRSYLESGHPSFRKIGRTSPNQRIILNPILQGAALIASPIFIVDHDSLFDERLFLYGEEFLLATECLIRGHLTLYTSQLVVLHQEGVTTATLPEKEKMLHGYEAALASLRWSTVRLEQQGRAFQGETLEATSPILDDLLTVPTRKVLVDMFFCQPGYHGGGEYGKAVFRKLADDLASRGRFELWAALNPELFIDPWIYEICREHAINIIAVRSYDEIVELVNRDLFEAFFAPALVVYTKYEYMRRVGGKLPFKCAKTKVWGTLHDIRDYQLACEREKVLHFRRSLGCPEESAMSERQIAADIAKNMQLAESLQRMYQGILNDPVPAGIITISEYSRSSIEKEIGQSAHPIRVFMSPMKARPAPAPFDDPAANYQDRNYVLLMHAARPEKNIAAAVVAFDQLFDDAHMMEDFADLHVVMTGITSLKDGLPNINHQERFYAIGELAPPQLEFLLANARFLMYPSLNEGLGYPPIEAMSLGVPSLVSRVTAIPEVCGEAVIYCDPYDIESIKNGIHSILTNPPAPDSIRSRYEKIFMKQKTDLDDLVRLIVES